MKSDAHPQLDLSSASLTSAALAHRGLLNTPLVPFNSLTRSLLRQLIEAPAYGELAPKRPQ